MRKYIYKIGIYILRLYWFIFRPNGYGVKCIIQNTEGKIILVRNTYGAGWWNLPGGGIDKGETPEQAARREVFEEVGMSVENLAHLGSFVSTFEYKRDHISVFFTQTTDDIGKLQADEIREARWFGMKELPGDLATVAEWSVELLKKNT